MEKAVFKGMGENPRPIELFRHELCAAIHQRLGELYEATEPPGLTNYDLIRNLQRVLVLAEHLPPGRFDPGYEPEPWIRRAARRWLGIDA